MVYKRRGWCGVCVGGGIDGVPSGVWMCYLPEQAGDRRDETFTFYWEIPQQTNTHTHTDLQTWKHTLMHTYTHRKAHALILTHAHTLKKTTEFKSKAHGRLEKSWKVTVEVWRSDHWLRSSSPPIPQFNRQKHNVYELLYGLVMLTYENSALWDRHE